MPNPNQCLFSLSSLKKEQVFDFFNQVKHLKQNGLSPFTHSAKPIVFLVFFEASTRTRVSFQTAAYRLGCEVVLFESSHHTSMAKGESALETLKTLSSMGPDLFVIRYGEDLDPQSLQSVVAAPIISAGGGVTEHPTQALLDQYTLFENLGDIEGKRVLFVGDVLHSRVARSNMEMLKILGAQVVICAPKELQVEAHQQPLFQEVSLNSDLNAELEQADVCMLLRPQLERHKSSISLESYAKNYGFHLASLKKLKKNSVVLHPGPFHPYVDLDPEVLSDHRVKIYDQVKNGVWVRAALMSHYLQGSSLL